MNRLTARSEHPLALKISEFLNLPPDPVLKHWAQAEISKTKSAALSGGGTYESDEDLCRIITEKFQSVGKGKVSYAETARRAWQVGRTALAIKVRISY